MASAAKQTQTIRKQKRAKKGNKRKAQLRNNGTTRTPAELFGDKE